MNKFGLFLRKGEDVSQLSYQKMYKEIQRNLKKKYKETNTLSIQAKPEIVIRPSIQPKRGVKLHNESTVCIESPPSQRPISVRLPSQRGLQKLVSCGVSREKNTLPHGSFLLEKQKSGLIAKPTRIITSNKENKVPNLPSLDIRRKDKKEEPKISRRLSRPVKKLEFLDNKRPKLEETNNSTLITNSLISSILPRTSCNQTSQSARVDISLNGGNTMTHSIYLKDVTLS